MFDQQGLSLDQAPPVSVVFGLFLTGALFGMLSGLLVLYYGEDIFAPSSIATIILTHVLALGVMMSFMLGALFQMLPVIAGIVLQNPVSKSNLVKILLILGTLSLIVGFATHAGFLFLLASVLLGSSLLYVAFSMGSKLMRLSNHSASSRGMLYAISSLVALVLLALYMTTTYAQMHNGGHFAAIKQMHYTFALFGWVALLIVSISFQTIEMFYVTPAYPRILGRYMPLGIFILLVVFAIGSFLGVTPLVSTIQLLLYLLLALYAIFTLRRLSQRKRPLTDATVWFWRIGMSSLIASMLLLILHIFISERVLFDFAVVLFVSFVLSVLFAMFYKIVPFLTWFHLNAQGYFTAPMMHEVIHPKTAKKHMWIHLAMLSSLFVSVFLPVLLYLSGILILLSFGWITYQILHANKLYKHTQKTGERFEMVMELPSD